MNRKRRRIALLVSSLVVLAVAVVLVLTALQDTIVFFYSPSDLQKKNVAIDTPIRLGGLIQTGSVVKQDNNVIEFTVTDGAASVNVHYKGIVPDLFREGQGIVAEGYLKSAHEFVADTILAKHDENYMPREVADALKKSGHWQGESKAP